MTKRFNVTGTCIPDKHYMVDISGKLDKIIKLIDDGYYFNINRPGQYGKTTTLYLLKERLQNRYLVIRTSFEGVGDLIFEKEEYFCDEIFKIFATALEFTDQEYATILRKIGKGLNRLTEVSRAITEFVKLVQEKEKKKVILIIDEVAKYSNNRLFLNFLGMLRDKYLKCRVGEDLSFYSIILAGELDVKNFYSTWNIAVEFKVEMAFSPEEIATMLKDYVAETGIEMDISQIAERLYYYTTGYPFLISKLCQVVDEEILADSERREWQIADLEQAVQIILEKSNINDYIYEQLIYDNIGLVVREDGDFYPEQVKKLPIGVSDFREMVEENYYYVDKTLFIKDIIDIGSKCILIPRPRRFGKTLNLSMLKYFFEKQVEDLGFLFHELAIWKTGEKYRKLQGKYPVIYLTFKDVKSPEWELCYEHLKRAVAREYKRHDYLLSSSTLDDIQKGIYLDIMKFQAKQADYENAIKNLSDYLQRYYDQKVMIFIDEYDTPIQTGFLEGYYDRIVNFMRNLLSGGLKDNSSLDKAVLTGILRIAKESIFTGINNFETYSLLREELSSYFGLLEDEVYKLLQYYNIAQDIDQVKSWYNGYVFGQNVIYNPWSILNYASNYKYGLYPYWANTSGNKLVKELITTGDIELKEDLERLISGKSIVKMIDENIVFEDLDKAGIVWSFLLFTGYLKPVDQRIKNKQWECQLKIPNMEVEYIYEQTIRDWFKASTTNTRLKLMLNGLVEGDIKTFEYYFKQFIVNTMSYFDPTGEEPERVCFGDPVEFK
jgi:hypothetical protein